MVIPVLDNVDRLEDALPDGFAVDRLFDATEAVVGPLEQPNDGIMFTLPVLQARGRGRRQAR